MKMLRQRRINETECNHVVKNEQHLLDNQEQDQIINDLQQECIHQTRQMAKFLSFLCYISGFLSFITLFLHTFEWNLSFYPVYVAALHCFAGRMAHGTNSTLGYLKDEYNVTDDGDANNSKVITGIGIAATILPIIVHMRMIQSTDDRWVWILCGSNIYTLIAVYFMQKDSMSTIASLKGLKNSRYKHKSL